jgi:hypothetical protein
MLLLRTVPLLLAAALAWPPETSAAPAAAKQTFVGRRSARFNRHSRGHRHASDRKVEAQVVVSLQPKRVVVVVDTGERAHSSMGPSSYSGEKTRWSNTWSGSYRRKGARLLLRLRLKKGRCAKTLTRRFGGHAATKTKEKCPSTPRTLTMRCTSEPLEVHPAANAKVGAKASKQPIWRCRPQGQIRTGGSRSPWVLGQRRCVEQYTLRWLRYRRCAQQKKP